MEKIYLDNAATTKPFAEEFDLIKNKNDEYFYNPSALYMDSLKVKKQFNEAREGLSKLIGGENGKLFFTSSATESNNTIFNGVHLRVGDVVLITKGEHPSVYNSAHNLEKRGIVVKDINLKSDGMVDENSLKNLLTEKVVLVSVIHVSNETGAINDIKNICKIVKDFNLKIVFHSDGVQAFGKIDVNLRELGIDLYTISAHKIHSFRGIAGLWIKKGIIVDPLLLGGGQEDGFRSSTENFMGAISFFYSAKRIIDVLDENHNKVLKNKNDFLNKISKSSIFNFVKVNSNENASPYILSLSFAGIKGEVLAHAMEGDGILISTGSACSAKKAGNRTLSAMGLSDDEVVGGIRISFSAYDDFDMDYVVACLEKNVLRFEKNLNIKK